MKYGSKSGKKGWGVASNTVGSERKYGAGESKGKMTGTSKHTLDHGVSTGGTGPKRSAGSNPQS
jgi:hypothetical protein